MKKFILWVKVGAVLASIAILIYGGIKVNTLFIKGNTGNALLSLAITILFPTILLETTFKKPDGGVRK